ncbi:MAG: KpsF/GutQ family sugar-phosphate isomerase [Pirellulales bacterium]
MSAIAHVPPPGTMSPHDQLRYAREVLQLEAQAVELAASRLDTEFCRAADMLFGCTGNVMVCGIGKAGLIGQKLTATLASTGTKAHFLHPAEAIHGDLGRIDAHDVALVLSQSGETEEITRLLPHLKTLNVPIVALTAKRGSSLGKAANVTIELGPLREACSLGLAPSVSTTVMLALGDALSLVVSRMRAFAREDFYRFHPGGALGRKLAKVEDAMRPLSDCRITDCSHTVREIFAAAKLPRRRTGAIMIVDLQGILRGIFTDSDLAKLFESRRDDILDQPIRTAMTKRPRTVPAGAMLSDALEILAERRISELPVVDADGRPVGMIDITDVLGLFPEKVRQTVGERDVPAGSGEALRSIVITTPLRIDPLDGIAAPHVAPMHGIVATPQFAHASGDLTPWVSVAHAALNSEPSASKPLAPQTTTPVAAPIPRPNAAGFFTSLRNANRNTTAS